jgi:hypothetical protein
LTPRRSPSSSTVGLFTVTAPPLLLVRAERVPGSKAARRLT